MNMHKRIRLTPLARKEIWQHYGTRSWTIVALAREFRVSRPTIYKVIDRARKQEFEPRKSTNKRFLAAKFGMKRLAKVEAKLEAKKKAQAKRYNKNYPGELMHYDTKRLPLLKGEKKDKPREYLFIVRAMGLKPSPSGDPFRFYNVGLHYVPWSVIVPDLIRVMT